jgi:fucose permease
MESERTYRRNVVFSAACVGILVFGIVFTTLGAILPSLIDRFDVDMARAGTLFTLQSLGILVGSLVFGPIVDRFGYRLILIVSALLIFGGIEGIAFADTFGLLQVIVFILGVSGGVLNGGTNALVADISEEGRGAGLSLFGVFFGIGAFGVPFVLSMLLDSFGYSEIVAGMGLVVIVPIVFFLVTRFPQSKQPHGFPLGQALGLLKDRTLLLFGGVLFLQSGLEVVSGGWSAEYCESVLGVSGSRAVLLLSLFWAGMVLARFGLGFWLRRGDPARALFVSIGVAMVGSTVLIQSSAQGVAAIGIFLMGTGLAAGFPVVLGLVGDLHPRLSGTAFSLVLVMALIGGSISPYLAGVVGEQAGLRTAFLLIPAGLIGITVLLITALRRIKAMRAEMAASV